MKEIGGYIELEHYHGDMLHENCIQLNCGRSCLEYLIRAHGIQKMLLPEFMCDSVFNLCERFGVQTRFYTVRENLRPEAVMPASDEWLYLMSYYGQLTDSELKHYANTVPHLIIDFSQDYFHAPVNGADCLYTCRKYFGVSDGGLLFSDARLREETLETDVSYDKMGYLLGRFEKGPYEFYQESAANNKRFATEPMKYMSLLTKNLLHAIDYTFVSKQRTENFRYLHEQLQAENQLKLRVPEGAFAYPYMVSDAAALRRYMIENKVFIPILWPNVIKNAPDSSSAYILAHNILPIPVDQRYTTTDMAYIVSLIQMFRTKNK